jgi:hypothetical protein
MPRAKYNISRQRSTSSAITINGLLTWRSRRVRNLRLKDGEETETLADIAAIDRVLVNVIGFQGDIEALSRDFRREAIFRHGELQRAVYAVLREASGPLTTRQITERVMAAKGKRLEAGRLSKEWINRVRKVCQRMPPVEMERRDGLQTWSRK